MSFETFMFLFLTIGIPVITYFIKAFTPAAASVASILLMTIGFASTESLYLIVIAFCAIALVEKIMGTKEKKHESRKISQLLANGGCGTVVAALYMLTNQDIFSVAFAAAIAEALCDSTASAIGTRVRGKCIDICNFQPIESGISGGVSVAGTMGCVVSAVVVAVLALAFRLADVSTMLIVFFSGIAGCFFDSYLGAKWQRKYRCKVCGAITEEKYHCERKTELHSGSKNIDNDAVNFLSNTFSVCVAITLWLLLMTQTGNIVLWYGALLVTALFGSGIAHELGHIIGCILTGSKIKGLKIWIIEFDFSGKHIKIQPKAENYVRFSVKANQKRFIVMVSGVVANLIVGCVTFCLSDLNFGGFLGIFAICNWYKAISNLLPIGKRDGAGCLQILRERNK